MRRVLAENHLVAEETAFVGDMAHDIEAAKKCGLLAAGILTGFDTVDKLAAAGAALIVKGFPELQQLLGTPRNEQDELFEISGKKVPAALGVAEEDRSSPKRLPLTPRI